MVKATDLGLLRLPGAPSLAPDRRHAAVSVKRIDLAGDRYRADLWLVPFDATAPPAAITSGELDTEPVWSPDGQWLAFLRLDPATGPQLNVMPAEGGAPRRVTAHPLGISEPRWAPDSTSIAYVARVPEDGRYVQPIGLTAASEPPRRITSLRYRADGLGYTNDRRAHIFLVGLDGAEPLQLTSGDADHQDLAWSQDGGRLAFASARHENRDAVPARDVFVMSLTDHRTQQVTSTTLRAGRPVFNTAGDKLYFLGSEIGGPVNETFFNTTGLWVADLVGGGPARRLTSPETVDIVHLTEGPALRIDDSGVLAMIERRGAVDLVRIDGSGEISDVIAGPEQVIGFDVVEGTIVASVANDTNAGELVTLSDDVRQTLTDFGSGLSSTTSIHAMREIAGEASDGYPVHGWVLRPAGTGPFPVVLAVHGGPYRQFGWRLLDQAQACVDAGYLVVMGNPRGSSGYGAEHGRAVRESFGDVDVKDLTALVDLAIAEHDGDPDRVGVVGASYGGFMAAWLAARSHRFAAAISDRPSVDWRDCDVDDDFDYTLLYIGADPAVQWEKSPLAHVHDVTMPVLVIVAEQDLRCAPGQGRQLFSALKRAGKQTELLSFPGASHMFHDSGLPSHRIARIDAIIDWFDRHLVVPGETEGAL